MLTLTTTTLVSLALLFHTLYLLRTLSAPPPNVFSALKIPVNTPTNYIRAILTQHTPNGQLPQHTSALLERLDSWDMRSLYIRFGHNVVMTCEHCQTIQDYALYALPRPALSYIREIILVGVSSVFPFVLGASHHAPSSQLLTLETINRSHLRPVGIGALVAAFVTEAYWLGTVPIVIPPPNTPIPQATTMWHDRLLLYRHTLFLILPPLLFLLPTLLSHLSRSPILYPILIRIPFLSLLLPLPLPPLSSLQGSRPHPHLQQTPAQIKTRLFESSLKTLDHLVPSLHLLKYTQAAAMRSGELRGRMEGWWEREREVGERVRGDEEVRRVARKQGLAFDEGVKPEEGEVQKEKEGEDGDGNGEVVREGLLRTKARLAVNGLFREAYPPSQHWIPT
ncbi:hypothetical protein AX17_004888 [Amanita inopinata Kibby_2008]|nr:hypothetical protein AX17_004888 [Amanita inopinata Kibby_2008]